MHLQKRTLTVTKPRAQSRPAMFCSEELTAKEIKFAFERWKVQNAKIFATATSPSQLRSVRIALGLTTTVVAENSKISVGQLQQFEKSEKLGTISLNNLRRVAKAMDCEVTYTIKHKTGKDFIQLAWEKLLPLCKENSYFRTTCWAPMRGYALYSMIEKKFRDSNTRVKLGWSNRVNFDKPQAN